MKFSGEIKSNSIGTKLYCSVTDTKFIDEINNELYSVTSYYNIIKSDGESTINKLDLTHYLYSSKSNNLPNLKQIGTIQTFTDDQYYSDTITLEFKKDTIGYYFEVISNDANYDCKLNIIFEQNYICEF